MDLLIIRHGQSEADLLNVFEGRANFDLTLLGMEQAERMAKWIKERYALTKIYASPLKRARQTAAALEKETGIAAIFDDDLMEFQNGLLAGMNKEEASEIYPEIKSKPLHMAVYGQESMLQFRMRAENTLSKILYENEEDAVVAVVTHGGTIRMLFRSFLNLPVASDISLVTGDTGIHLFRIINGVRSIMFANSRAHLTDEN